MAALLVALGVMAVLMSAVLPAWRHQAKREKEAELVFRGEQYARAIGLWERKMGPGSRPPSVDILVQQKFLRKKYKDPMTADGEFQPIVAGVQPSTPGMPPTGRGSPPQPQPRVSAGFQATAGGIFGVQSKSTAQSIRLYRGRGRYNEWQFVHAGTTAAPGGGSVGEPGERGRGGRRGDGSIGGGGRGGGGRGPGRRGGLPQGADPDANPPTRGGQRPPIR